MNEVKNRKIFVVDTSVLLYDKFSLFNMKGNDIIIPLIVLEELDKFKTREGILGDFARFFNRFLDDLRKEGTLYKGIYLKDKDISIKVSSEFTWEGLEGLDKSQNDNKIIANANYYKLLDKNKSVVVISKDINLRVRCDSVGIHANDYYADYEFVQRDNLYQGHNEILVDADLINRAYSGNHLKIKEDLIENGIDLNISENGFLIIKSNNGNNQSCLMMRKKDRMIILENKKEIYKKTNIEPKNKEQVFALNILLDEDISLVSLTGVPGSGKTYLALMTALKFIEKDSKKRIIFTRPIQTVGKDIGFLPGSLEEKMSPWLAPIVDNFRNQFGDLTYFEMMLEKGQIDVAPLSHIRGRSFNDSVIIVDEAQNATVHELKTVITRTGKNSKIILLGDIEQVDLPYINKFSNGLTIVAEKLKEETLTGHVNFTKGYRSELANIVAEKL
jgi:PhoH-like ATPase